MKPIKEQLKKLLALQEIDLQIEQIRKSKGAGEEALKLLASEITQVQAQIEKNKVEVESVDKKLGEISVALSEARQGEVRAQQKLDGASNTVEFQAANRELEQIKKAILGLEEQEKIFTQSSGRVHTEKQNFSDRFSKLETKRTNQTEFFENQSKQADKQISQLMEGRKEFLPAIEPRVVAQYDRIRAMRAGLGIAPILAGNCKGCNRVVPPQMVNVIQRAQEIHQCPSCNRILVLPE